MNIYWDIDGTLINTGEVGGISETLIKQEYNIMLNKHFCSTKTGITDRFYIFQLFILCFNRVPDTSELNSFGEKYSNYIIRLLKQEKNKALIDDKKIFDHSKYKHRVFTGNFKNLAKNKIDLFYDISRFDWENSIYGDYTFTKKEALESYYRKKDEAYFNNSIFVSDSINDIAVAKSVGAFTIGLLTGNSTYKDMEVVKPNYIWNNVPQYETFYKQLEMLGS